jgi:hypothetical protein
LTTDPVVISHIRHVCRKLGVPEVSYEAYRMEWFNQFQGASSPWNTPLKVFPVFHFPATHFVGFRGAEYHSAVRVFGPPDFIHPVWDVRAQHEVAPNDRVIFARGKDAGAVPTSFSWNDSERF